MPWGHASFVNKALRDWTIGGVLRYASGMPIPVPVANNQLSAYTFQSTLENRVPGVPLFLDNLNCHCFDPSKTFVLNPAAWVNPANGTFGTSAPYYNDFRYQRRPDEELSLAREFRLREHMTFSLRLEAFNVFNRTIPSKSGGQQPAEHSDGKCPHRRYCVRLWHDLDGLRCRLPPSRADRSALPVVKAD